jgi:hypothetical protein
MSLALPSFAELNPAAWIKLADGRPIVLQRLVQSQTYGGLLLGLPNERVNKGIVDRVCETAREEFGKECEPVLIQPVLLPFTEQRQRRRLSKAGLGAGEGEIEQIVHDEIRLLDWAHIARDVSD